MGRDRVEVYLRLSAQVQAAAAAATTSRGQAAAISSTSGYTQAAAAGATTTTGGAAAELVRQIQTVGATSTAGQAAVQLLRNVAAAGASTSEGQAAAQALRQLAASGATTTVGQAVASTGASVTYLGDSFSTVPHEAWSVHEAIVSTYSGPLVLVRRSGDDAEMAFGLLSGRLDTASLVAWVVAGGGTMDGHVKALYGQFNGYDLTQATTTNQPKIVDSGTLVTLGGAASMLFGGADYLEYAASSLGVSGASDVMLGWYMQAPVSIDMICQWGTGAGSSFEAYGVNVTTLRVDLFGSAGQRNFSASNMGAAPYAYGQWLASGAEIQTAVAYQDGVALSEIGTVNPTDTLSMSTGGFALGARVGGLIPLSSGSKLTSMLAWTDISNAVADYSAYKAYTDTEYA